MCYTRNLGGPKAHNTIHVNISYKVGRIEEYPFAGYDASLEPSGTVGSFVKALLGEEITVALISLGASFGVSQAVDSARNSADDEGENSSEAGFGQLVRKCRDLMRGLYDLLNNVSL